MFHGQRHQQLGTHLPLSIHLWICPHLQLISVCPEHISDQNVTLGSIAIIDQLHLLNVRQFVLVN